MHRCRGGVLRYPGAAGMVCYATPAGKFNAKSTRKKILASMRPYCHSTAPFNHGPAAPKGSPICVEP